ncbi:MULTISPECIES: DUF4333 domain-containing protein [Mycolicibacterium]|uniref:DUF4333 domain-containing protein n=1 Tax=Mycolicibacterium phocaicum TaxID=319706 RepID=A0A7I7ZUU4_9MYCO|nr:MULTISPECIES: DUF4333 domain-containing protein [Mycolicibacterium]TLH59893.1 hypothetical protein C1S79_26580 [Mycolicibacterium phocaicum]BBZ56904.1 hypothetical protein MPHO_38960 [Mycolicibacterium phocaicum]GCA97261.1 hypothetical protein NCCNTM_08960 [Mycolicibacterium sp. NCC-Tsukiji]
MDGRSTTRWFAALAAAGLLTSCSFHIGTGAATMPKDKLETAVKSKLSTKTTSTIDSVVCDGGLEAKVGAAQTCTVVTGKTSRRATVRAVDIRGSDIALSIELIPGK